MSESSESEAVLIDPEEKRPGAGPDGAGESGLRESDHTRKEMLDVVKRSPAAVAAKDRDAWVAIFAAYNIVEDPVGSAPHISGVYDPRSGKRGNGPLERFFDTFIAPNGIEFHVERDIVNGYHVMRDMTIDISMSPTVRVKVPMHALYVLGEQGGSLRVFRLAAHWELVPMVKQALSFGGASLAVMAALGWRMLRIQGLAGIWGFCRGVRTVGQRGKHTVEAFATAFNAGDRAGMETLFDSHLSGVSWPAPGRRVAVSEFMQQASGQLSWTKVLVSGHVVTASCAWTDGGRVRHGVVVFEFTRQRKIDRVSAYWE